MLIPLHLHLHVITYFFFKSTINDCPQHLNLLACNINSVPRHLDSFIDMCLSPSNNKYDVLGFCETRLAGSISSIYGIEFL